MSSITVVILAYGPEEWLGAAVASALATPEAEVVVVDNGCTSDAVRTLPADERIHVLTPPHNLGFAGGVNAGVAASSGVVVCMLNSDAELEPGALEALVRALDDGADIAGGMILLADSPEIVNSAGNPIHVLGLVWAGHLGEPRALIDPRQEPTTLSGACLAMRRVTWEALGGFDAEFFAYHEDVDLCWRARQRGMTLRLVHDAGVLHHYEFSRNPEKMFYIERNRLLFVLTTYEAATLALLSLPLLALDLSLLLVAVRQGWGREKVRGWMWVTGHLPYLAARRRRVAAARVVGDDVLGELLTTTFDPTQVPLPKAGRPLELMLRAWWRAGRRLLGRRTASR
ncbi:MAG TPA: glycosyltransferase family 2 protein [Propionibacteriaceae bacterium]|nr:glycosyltransferase family 2 protein [Propionibacteriaceae bacterium]